MVTRTLSILLLTCMVALGQPFTFHDQAWLGQIATPATGGGPPPSTFPATNDIVAFWRMDETSGTRVDAFDDNDLTDGSSVGYGTGIITNGADFESTSTDYLTIADNDKISLGTDSALTIVLWAKVESFIAGHHLVSKRTGSGTGTEYALTIVDGTGTADYFQLQVSEGSSTAGIVQASTFGQITGGATWLCVIAWHDPTNNTLGISVNGTTNIASYASGTQNTAAALDIGRATGSILYFDGIIDEVGIWKRVLSESERTAFYNSGSGVPYP